VITKQCFSDEGCRSDPIWNRTTHFKSVDCLLRCLLAGLLLYFLGPAHAQNKAAERVFVAYYESWLASADPHRNVDEVLAGLPRVLDVVNLAFMRPDAHYSGQFDLSGTGLEFQYGGAVLKSSIRRLKEKSPNTKVLVAVGGSEAANWAHFAPAAIARFVRDFELDGVDIDFEPTSPRCRKLAEKVRCDTDELLLKSITDLRSLLPRPAVMSLTAHSTSAFGEDRWRDASPQGGPNYGMLLGFLRNRHASEEIDLLNIMAYDAGSDFDPIQAYDAFRHYFRGPILIGFTPPPEAWGEHAYSPAEVARVLRAALRRGAAGAMLFGLRKMPAGSSRGSGGLSPFVAVISGTLAAN
jgi:chitinase